MFVCVEEMGRGDNGTRMSCRNDSADICSLTYCEQSWRRKSNETFAFLSRYHRRKRGKTVLFKSRSSHEISSEKRDYKFVF